MFNWFSVNHWTTASALSGVSVLLEGLCPSLKSLGFSNVPLNICYVFCSIHLFCSKNISTAWCLHHHASLYGWCSQDDEIHFGVWWSKSLTLVLFDLSTSFLIQFHFFVFKKWFVFVATLPWSLFCAVHIGFVDRSSHLCSRASSSIRVIFFLSDKCPLYTQSFVKPSPGRFAVVAACFHFLIMNLLELSGMCRV